MHLTDGHGIAQRRKLVRIFVGPNKIVGRKTLKAGGFPPRELAAAAADTMADALDMAERRAMGARPGMRLEAASKELRHNPILMDPCLPGCFASVVDSCGGFGPLFGLFSRNHKGPLGRGPRNPQGALDRWEPTRGNRSSGHPCEWPQSRAYVGTVAGPWQGH